MSSVDCTTSLVKEFLKSVHQSLTIGHGQPEAQLTGPTQYLLEGYGQHTGLSMECIGQAVIASGDAIPDFAVYRLGLLTGHVELKAPGKGANPKKFSDRHDRRQWGRLKSLPNLIYTDGFEWALYHQGDAVYSLEFPNSPGTMPTKAQIVDFDRMLRTFASWEPIPPNSAEELARRLAPLCRLVRDCVLDTVSKEDSPLNQLAQDWRQSLFPDADEAQFADAYAQTLTYALLLARLDSATIATNNFNSYRAVESLDAGYGLLAQALKILTDPMARKDIETGVSLLERTIGAVDPSKISSPNGGDVWLYFYEQFLAEYDPKLRKDRGVYYTPFQVVHCQVRLIQQLLVEHFGKPCGFGDSSVVTLDPAVGTGTYVLGVIDAAAKAVEERFGSGAVSDWATKAGSNLYGFEILVGPYTVAHLRVTQRLRELGGEAAGEKLGIYLTDTLESPFKQLPGQLPLVLKRLGDEYKRARKVKEKTRVLVCLGNPPYDRQEIDLDDKSAKRKGGWVRFGDPGEGDQGILKDFMRVDDPSTAAIHFKNLYNDYVYFWRWALWKVLDSTNEPGIVSFITPSSYLRGPGFPGMRRFMREVFDELWIIDLEGDQTGARKTENIFRITTPVAIAIGARYSSTRANEASKVYYTKISGTADDKLTALEKTQCFEDLKWHQCFDDWEEPFLPSQSGDFFSWPALTDLFPWQHSGVQMKRIWPIGPSPEVLRTRWRQLVKAPRNERRKLFHESSDRKVNGQYTNPLTGKKMPLIGESNADAQSSPIVRYGFRSLDRQWILADYRVGDRMRPSLWSTYSSSQLFLVSFLTGVLGLGPAAIVSAYVPDLDFFRGSFGGKHVIPLWRNADATEPNVTNGILSFLSDRYGFSVLPADLLAYCYALLASTAYVDRFSEELTIPGPRVPITKEPALFRRIVEEGRMLVWLHTYGDRMAPQDSSHKTVICGEARCTTPISSSEHNYPDSFKYDGATRTLHVGCGTIYPVSQEVWDFEISGLRPVDKWLGYRMRIPAGRKSSPLDDIMPSKWPAEFTTELLELLWVLEATVKAQPRLGNLLGQVVEGPVFSARDFPKPSAAERRPPARNLASTSYAKQWSMSFEQD